MYRLLRCLSGIQAVLRICAIMSFGLSFLCCTASMADPGSDETGTHKDANTTIGFCLCSPGPVSDKVDVELRLGIRNQAAVEGVYDVTFFLDKIESKQAIHTEQVRAKAGSNNLVSYWWPTSGHVGNRKIIYKVESGGKTVGQGEWPLDVYPSDTRCLPWATGVWLDPGGWQPGAKAKPEDIKAMVDSMHDLGAQMIIICYVEGGGTWYPSKITELGKQLIDFDLVQVILDQAQKNGQHVVLGIGRGPDMELLWGGCQDPVRLAKGLGLSKQVGKELWNLYGAHPAFYGWYLTHEANDIHGGNPYYNPISDYLHDFAPEKPVMIAPAGTPIVTPGIVSDCHCDAFLYQDAVGAGYVPYVYTYDPQKRLDMLDDVCASYRAAHYGTRKHLWSDTETWQMTGPVYGIGYGAEYSRVKRQIEIETPYYDMITFYTFFTMAPPSVKISYDDDRARNLYREYKKYYDKQSKKARKALLMQVESSRTGK